LISLPLTWKVNAPYQNTANSAVGNGQYFHNGGDGEGQNVDVIIKRLDTTAHTAGATTGWPIARKHGYICILQ
jgi:hypothetical protein